MQMKYDEVSRKMTDRGRSSHVGHVFDLLSQGHLPRWPVCFEDEQVLGVDLVPRRFRDLAQLRIPLRIRINELVIGKMPQAHYHL